MEESRGGEGASSTSEAPSLSQTAGSGAMQSAISAPSDLEESGFESSSPAVLAQPLAEGAGGNLSKLRDGDSATASKSQPTLARVKEVLASAQDTVATRYRVVSESTDDFVHDSPWKAIGFAVLGGIIVGMLAAR